jgi:hypothetical protein
MNTDKHEFKRNDSALSDRIVAILEQARSNLHQTENATQRVAN